MRQVLWLTLPIFLVACSDKPPEPRNQQQTPIPQVMRLPVSINDVMVALVNEAADPIWVAAWREPATEEQWRELERRAYQLKLAGSLIAYPGTGPSDEKWTAKPPWKRWSTQLRDAGSDAIAAVEARDKVAIAKAGDRIVEVCEGCHIDFKTAFPTGGKFGELSPTANDFED